MRNLLAGLGLQALVSCATAGPAPAAQTPPAACAEPAPAPPAAAVEPAQAAPTAPPPTAAEATDNGLNDLATLTFDCPKAALNAAAREAAKVRAEGTYQFSHFGIVSDTHQAVYEVHFKSNYQEEPILRYCVAIYCQQGWDPKSTQATVSLLSEPGSRAATPKAQNAHAANDTVCGGKHTHAAARRVE